MNTNISSDCYTVLPILHSDITAIQFKGEYGNLTIINIYNEITNNNTIHCLDDLLSLGTGVPSAPGDHMFWLGDFNRHHPMWEDESNEHLFKSEDFIQPFLELLYKFNMVMALPSPCISSTVRGYRLTRLSRTIGHGRIMFGVQTTKTA